MPHPGALCPPTAAELVLNGIRGRICVNQARSGPIDSKGEVGKWLAWAHRYTRSVVPFTVQESETEYTFGETQFRSETLNL
jgi:hypothetical protein